MSHGLCQSGVSKKRHPVLSENHLFPKIFSTVEKAARGTDEFSATGVAQNVTDRRENRVDTHRLPDGGRGQDNGLGILSIRFHVSDRTHPIKATGQMDAEALKTRIKACMFDR
jgi:hypothetical protein